MTDDEMQAGLTRLEAAFSGLRDKVSDMDRDLGVTKHAVANVQQSQSGMDRRLDKLEERISQKIDILSDKLGTVNNQQARGLGFFGGMAFMITIAGGLLLALGKLLFAA